MLNRPFVPVRPLATFARGALLAITLLGACAATAQVVFTVEATATGAGPSTLSCADYGYTIGQSYTFVFTLKSTVSQATLTAGSSFDTTSNWWAEYNSANATLFSQVSGTGLKGVYIQTPVASTFTSVNSSLIAYANSTAELSVSANLDNDPDLENGGYINNYDGETGLKMADNTHGLSSIAIYSLTPTSPSFLSTGFDSVYVDPNGFWRSNLISRVEASGNVYLTPYGNPSSILFTVTYLSITDASAVPEPSTCAAFAGFAALGLVAYRRRRA